MNYCILNQEGLIENIIACAGSEEAAAFGGVESYEGARIGDLYAPPAPPPTLEERVAALEKAVERGLSL